MFQTSSKRYKHASIPACRGLQCIREKNQRHIKPHDVYEIAEMVTVEYNIEGDPRPDLLDMVIEVAARPVHTCSRHTGRGDERPRLESNRRKGKDSNQSSNDSRMPVFVSVYLAVQIFIRSNWRRKWVPIGLNSIPRLMRGRKPSRRLHRNLVCSLKLLKRRSAWVSASMQGHDLNLENLPLMRGSPRLT